MEETSSVSNEIRLTDSVTIIPIPIIDEFIIKKVTLSRSFVLVKVPTYTTILGTQVEYVAFYKSSGTNTPVIENKWVPFVGFVKVKRRRSNIEDPQMMKPERVFYDLKGLPREASDKYRALTTYRLDEVMAVYLRTDWRDIGDILDNNLVIDNNQLTIKDNDEVSIELNPYGQTMEETLVSARRINDIIGKNNLIGVDFSKLSETIPSKQELDEYIKEFYKSKSESGKSKKKSQKKRKLRRKSQNKKNLRSKSRRNRKLL